MYPNYAKACDCGAVSVTFSNGASSSMSRKQFDEEFSNQIKLESDTYGCCDYCVNKYGVDLCGCGSGMPVGECDNNFPECRAKEASQIMGVQKETGWKF